MLLMDEAVKVSKEVLAVSHSMFGDQVAAAAMVAWGMEKVKRCPRLPWINQETDNLNMFVSACAALISSGLLSLTFEGSIWEGGKFSGTLPPFMDVLHFFGFDVTRAIALQEAFYKSAFKKPTAVYLPQLDVAQDAVPGSPAPRPSTPERHKPVKKKPHKKEH